MYFSRSAWRKVRGSSQFCLGRRKEAAVGDLLLPGGEYQSLLRDDNERLDQPTLEVTNTLMCSVVFAPRGVVPFDSQPLALLVCHLADVADGACLTLQAESLTYVCVDFRHGGFGTCINQYLEGHVVKLSLSEAARIFGLFGAESFTLRAPTT
jgi:hypothetical protein